MKWIKARLFVQGLALLLAAVPAGLRAADADSYLVAKGRTFEQTGSGAPALNTEEPPYIFLCEVKPSGPSSIINASFRAPNLTVHVLPFDAGDEAFSTNRQFSIQSQLETAFGSGNYQFAINGSVDGVQMPTLAVPTTAFPNAPHLTNWTAAQAVNVSQPFTLWWDEFNALSGDDFIEVELESDTGGYSSPSMGEPGALVSTNRFFTIPANELLPGVNYRGRLLFAHVVALNTEAYPGAAGIVGFFTETKFSLTTLNPAGTLQFSEPAITVVEGAGPATVTVTRTGGSQGTVTVQYSTFPQSAQDNVDFTPASGTLTFGPGVTNQTFQVDLAPDSLLEGAEDFRVALSLPTGDANLGVIASAVVNIQDDEVPAGPNTLLYLIGKGHRFMQTNASSVVIGTNEPYGLFGFIVPSAPGAVTNASVRAPNGNVRAYEMELGDQELSLQHTFSVSNLLQSTYGAGNYTFTIRGRTDGTRMPVISFPNAAFPNPPRVLNWESAQGFDASADFTLQIEPLTNAAAADSIFLEIADDQDNTVYENGEEFFLGNGASTSLVIPADALEPSRSYLARITYARPVTLNSNAYPGALGVAANFRETIFPIATLDPAPAAGRFQLAAASYSVSETGRSIMVTINRVGGSEGLVTVDLTASSGTAVMGEDFPDPATMINLNPGETNISLFVPITDDFLLEGTESFTVSLANPTGGTDIGSPGSATVTILDNENTASGVFEFSATNYPVAENVVSVTVQVRRTGGTAAASTVEFTTADDVAIDGEDYTGTNGILSFGAGESSKSFTVRLTNDALDETNETFFVLLGNPTGGAALGPRNFSKVTINDNDSGGVIAFNSATYRSGETAGVFSVTLARTGGTAGDVTVGWNVTGGTATVNADYSFTAGTVSFGSNDLVKTFPVTILADDMPDGDETVNLTLLDPTGGATLGALSNAVLNILDDEVTVQFARATFTNSETGPTAAITLVRSGPTTSAVTVRLQAGDGTATATEDYTAVNTNLMLAAGAASRTFALPIRNDTVVEGNETVVLTLSNPVGAQIGGQDEALLTILDNDLGGTIEFSAANYVIAESGPAARVLINRAGGLASGVTVNLATANDSAAAGADYTGWNTNLAFAANEKSKTVLIPILNDSLDETNEKFNLVLSGVLGGATLGVRSNASVTITDNDVAGALAFSAATYTVSETGTVATIIVKRTGGSASGVTVDFTATNGTATAGNDFTATNGTLTFGSNEMMKTFAVAILPDGAADGDETVLLTLLNPAGGATLGKISNSVLTILDDEISIQFSSASYTNSEAGPTATITFVRGGPTTGAVGFNFATSDGTATNALDYRGVNTNLTLAAGARSRTFTVPIINDALVEGNETVNLALGSPTGAQLGPRTAATLHVIENDLGGVIQFSATNYVVRESGTAARVTISRTSGSASNVTVMFATANGTATAGLDYTTVTTNLTFAANETTKTINVPVSRDALAEGSETVLLSLTNPTGGSSLGTRSNATVTITNVAP